MKVYRLKNNVNHYQYFLPQSTDGYQTLRGNCHPKAKSWVPPKVYVYQPLLKRGSLYNFGSSMPIFSPQATEVLRTQLEMSGELLPLPYESEIFTVLNVLECVNCLDQTRVIWKNPQAPVAGIQQYAFHSNRFPESMIFKIPETHQAEVLVLERDYLEGDIPTYLSNHGLEGILLEEIWHT